ncbi:MAG: hypothetical protein ACK4ST_10430 [Elioraea tepidiphila]
MPEGGLATRDRHGVAPDATGLNLYRVDPSLSLLLDLYLPTALRASRTASRGARRARGR